MPRLLTYIYLAMILNNRTKDILTYRIFSPFQNITRSYITEYPQAKMHFPRDEIEEEILVRTVRNEEVEAERDYEEREYDREYEKRGEIELERFIAEEERFREEHGLERLQREDYDERYIREEERLREEYELGKRRREEYDLYF